MKSIREIIGYALGVFLFIVLLPFIMWFASSMPTIWPVETIRFIIAALFIVMGLTLSIYTVVYMRQKGDGNPLDAFGHEVAPRTKHLMTGGPYQLNRNPMLTGIFIYLIGICIWLLTWQSVLVFVAFAIIMLIQVVSEEKRLRQDFGQKYIDYTKKVKRF